MEILCLPFAGSCVKMVKMQNWLAKSDRHENSFVLKEQKKTILAPFYDHTGEYVTHGTREINYFFKFIQLSYV